jgi:hypothetical protein
MKAYLNTFFSLMSEGRGREEGDTFGIFMHMDKMFTTFSSNEWQAIRNGCRRCTFKTPA